MKACRKSCLSVLLGPSMMLSASAASKAEAPSSDYALAFSDDFSGSSVDTQKWNFRTEIKAMSAQLPTNAIVEKGRLSLLMKKESVSGKNYTGAGIISKEAFRYGYYEVDMKMTSNSGWWNAFWMMHGDGSSSFGADQYFEIDVAEVDTRARDLIMSGLLVWNGDPGPNGLAQPLCSSRSVPKIDTAAAFHTYAAEWKEGEVAFYLDDKLYCTLTYSPSEYRQDALNIWLTALGWGEPITVGGTPQLFDNVRYYKKDYYISAGEPGYAEEGSGWADSNLAGFGRNPQRRSCAKGSAASWTPSILQAGSYNVQIWKTADPNADTKAAIEVRHAGGVDSQDANFATGASGWLDLGTFKFGPGTAGRVINRVSSGCQRAGMVKFVRM